MTRNRVLSLLGILIFVVIIGYFGNPLPKSETWEHREGTLTQLQAQLHKLANRIQTAQGKVGCVNDSQCRVVGLGAKVCDRYKSFLIYSTLDVEEPKLLTLVTEFNRLDTQLLDLALTANSCGVEPAAIHCVARRCVPDTHLE